MSLSNNFAQGAEQALPCIFAVEGLSLSEGEASLFAQSNPFGFILFKRNCDNPEQVKALVNHLKELVGRDCPILIDQEGGRVVRLKPPHWNEYKPMGCYGQIHKKLGAEEAKQALREDMAVLAGELVDLGINVNCAPVLDVFFDDAHEIIGDRAFSNIPAVVAELGEVVCEVFLEAGVTPVIKHIPGHGRALADSHEELPHVKDVRRSVLTVNDFSPFTALSRGKMGAFVWAMTAHMTYDAFKEDLPVSLSVPVIQKIIRKQIGFEGVLICDDLDMKALDAYASSVGQKALMALAAGCDLALYCSGKLKDMEELAKELPKIGEVTLERLKKAADADGVTV